MNNELDKWKALENSEIEMYATLSSDERCNNYGGSLVWQLAVDVQQLRKIASKAAKEIIRLRTLVADYEDGIDWHTTCTNCAKLLDDNYDKYTEIEQLRAAGNLLVSCLDEWTSGSPHVADAKAMKAWKEACNKK
jgi:hypothetical protein